MRLDPQIIKHQIDNLVAAYPELAEENEDWSLVLASETELDEFLTKLIRMIDDAKALVEGTKGRQEELQERCNRFGRRIDAYRSLVLKVMEAANIQKRELPEATIFVRNGTPKVMITDETILPSSCVKTTTSPDRTAIKTKLVAGETISGSTLSNAEPVLTIRVK
jgi:hypothetical protein